MDRIDIFRFLEAHQDLEIKWNCIDPKNPNSACNESKKTIIFKKIGVATFYFLVFDLIIFLLILRGMKKNLKKGTIKLLKVELCFPLMHKNVNYNYLDIINYLKKFNYNLFSISKIKYKNNEILFIDAFFKKKK